MLCRCLFSPIILGEVADLLDEALETAKKGDDGAEPKMSEPEAGGEFLTGSPVKKWGIFPFPFG